MEETMIGNRWLVLLSTTIIMFIAGSVYAWSVFQRPLMQLFKWSVSETSLAFTINISIVPVSFIVGGLVQDRYGPKRVIFAGGLLFSIGVMLAGFSQSLTHLYLTYGALGGLGIGAISACSVANTVKWFPDRRGLAAGVVVGGYGFGALIIGPIASMLVHSYGVLDTFKIIGGCYLVSVCSLSIFVHTAPPGYKPDGWNPPIVTTPGGDRVKGLDVNWKPMLTKLTFWRLWLMFVIGGTSGLMIIGHAVPIGQGMVKLSLSAAVAGLSFLALANAVGRTFWGWVSDHIGRYATCMVIYVIAAVAMYTLSRVSGFAFYVVILMLIGSCFGGFLGTFPAIVAEEFGTTGLGLNYGIMFTGYGLAGFIGSRLAARIVEMNNGDYSVAFYIAACLSLIGVVLALDSMRQQKRKSMKVAV
jgi:OFA family oxalate/formate antiporter-like MFS transporter